MAQEPTRLTSRLGSQAILYHEPMNCRSIQNSLSKPRHLSKTRHPKLIISWSHLYIVSFLLCFLRSLRQRGSPPRDACYTTSTYYYRNVRPLGGQVGGVAERPDGQETENRTGAGHPVPGCVARNDSRHVGRELAQDPRCLPFTANAPRPSPERLRSFESRSCAEWCGCCWPDQHVFHDARKQRGCVRTGTLLVDSSNRAAACVWGRLASRDCPSCCVDRIRRPRTERAAAAATPHPPKRP